MENLHLTLLKRCSSGFKFISNNRIATSFFGLCDPKASAIKTLLLFIIASVFSANLLSQTTFTATSSGDWTTYSWVKSGAVTTAIYPGQPGHEAETHDVVITGGGGIGLNINVTSSVRNITINSTQLAVDGFTLTMSGNLAGNGSVSFTNGTINIAGNNTIGSFTSSTGTFNYNGVNQTVKSGSYNNLLITGAGTKTAGADITVNRDFIINAGTFQAGANRITASGTTTITGGGTFTTSSNLRVKSFQNLILSGGTVSNTSGNAVTMNIGGNLLINNNATSSISDVTSTITGTTTIEPGATISFTGATSVKTFTGLITINGSWDNSENETINISNGLTFNGTSFISGNGQYNFNTNFQNISGTGPLAFDGIVNVVSPAVVNNKSTVTLRSVLSGGGSWKNDNGSVLNYEAAIAPTVTGFIVNTNSNLVNYSSAGAQIVKTGFYYNLQTSGSGSKTLEQNISVIGNLTIGTGTVLDVSAGDYQITLSDSWINEGTFNPQEGKVVLNGTGPQLITNSGGTEEIFYRLESNTVGPVTSDVDIAVNSTFILNSGKILMPGRTFTLGVSAADPGNLIYTSGWVSGNFARWMVNDNVNVYFPVGDDNYNRLFTANFADITTAGLLTVSFNPSVPSSEGMPLFEDMYYLRELFPEGYWTIGKDGDFAFTANFDMKFVPSGFTTYSIGNTTRVVSRNAGDDWALNGIHHSGSVSEVGRDDLNNFMEQYAIAHTEICEGTFLNCPADITIDAAPGTCSQVVSWTAPVISVPCPTYTMSSNFAPGSTFSVGTTQVVYTLKNGAVEVDFCIFNVTVVDNSIPDITCIADQTRNVDPASCFYTINAAEMDPVYTSVCPPTLTNDLTGNNTLAGAQIPVGLTTVLWTITGPSGNSASCSMNITVVDNILPTLSAVADKTEYLGPACSFTIPDYTGETTVSDNCGDLVVSQSPSAGTVISGVGTTQLVNITAVDPSGNTSSTSFNITLADNTPPVALCRNITVMLNASGTVTILPAAINNGSTDNCGVPILSLSKSDFNCTNIGANTVTLTVTDGSGNFSTCISTVTIVDNIPPSITCPAGISQNADPGLCSASVAVPAPVTTDNCSATLLTWSMTGATIAVSPATGINPVGTYSFNTGITTVTYTSGDVSGNTSTCSFSVTVTDNQNPVISGCPADIVQNVDPATCGAVVSWIEPTAIDNCTLPASLSWTRSAVPGNTFPVGVTTVTYTVSDAAGNQDVCTFSVTVVDNEVPVINCPANITDVTDPGVCTASVTVPDESKSDNCLIAVLRWEMTGATIATSPLTGLNKIGTYSFNQGITNITYTVEDAAGNTANCTFTVTVNDGQDPVINGCPSNIVQSNDAGSCNATVTWTEPIAMDNCTASGGLIWTKSHLPGSIFPIGVTTVTYDVQDLAGNSSTCSFTVTVSDNEDPSVTCPADINQLAGAGLCTGSVIVPDAAVNDNCAVTLLTWSMTGATIASSPAAGINQVGTQTFNTGVTTITYTVADAAGNDQTCSMTVTIAEDQLPVILCPADISEDTDPGLCTASVPVPDPVTSDNCAVTLVTWTMAGATSGSSPVTGINMIGTRIFNKGVTTINYTVADGSGNMENCSFTVTITDDEAPVITAPADIVRHADAGVCSASVIVPDAVFSDNCTVTLLTWNMTGKTIGSSPATGINQAGTQTFNPGTTTITYTAGDADGHTTTSSMTVTVIDTENPVISSCPVDIVQPVDAGSCTATVTWTEPSVADNCTATGDIIWTKSVLPGSIFPVGVTTVDYVAQDTSGNQTFCSFTVTITDNEIPVITCSADVTGDADAGLCTASVTIPDAVISDNCNMSLTWTMAGATTDASPNTGINQIGTYIFRSGVTTVGYTIRDDAGNQAVCSFTVTINANDVIAPVVACPADITQTADAGVCSSSVTVPDATMSDNCFVTLLTWAMTGATNASSPLTGINQVGTYTFNGGITTVTYTVGDGSGNQSTCSFTVIVTDDEAPQITCPADVTVSAASGACSANAIVPAPVTSDNCAVHVITNSFNGTADATGTYPIGETLVTWTVTDMDGNSSTCTHTVTVTSTFVPALISSDPDNSICLGETVTFTASGGITYEFLLNGVSVQGPGANNIYTPTSLADQDRVAVRMTDGTGCEGFSPGIITTVNPLPAGSVTPVNVSCFGGSTGSIDLLPSGGTAPYTFAWSNGETDEDVSSLAAGSYNVIITDANNCQATVNAVITQPAEALLITTTKVDVSCYGSTNGSALVVAAGGTLPYTYSWDASPVQSTAAATGLVPGTYNVTVTDSQGCIASGSVQISEPDALNVTEVHQDASCPDESDASITLTITGGTGSYNAYWSDGSTYLDRTGIDSGNYRVIITDSLGCAASADIVVGFEGTFNCVMVPQLITPNSDGYNDTWIMRNIDLYPDAEVRIFNRWGDLIFRTKNILGNPWDGTHKGQKVPSDSYHYILYLNDGSSPKSGVISVIR